MKIQTKFFFTIFILFLQSMIYSLTINDNKTEEDSTKRILERKNFKFGMELVRTDKANKEILVRKLEYPLKFIKQEWNEKFKIMVSNYTGRIVVPLEIYNPEKKDLAEQSAKVKRAYINYVLSIFPLELKDDVFTCQLFYMVDIFNITFKEFDGKKFSNENAGNQGARPIKIKLGEKVKIDLEGAYSTIWGIEDTIDGAPVTFRANEDYNNYFNDYMIISLESEGSTETEPVIPQKPKTVQGLVVDKITNKPIDRGIVMLLKNKVIQNLYIVDSTGVFKIDNLFSNNFTLFSKRIGYKELITGPIPITKIDTMNILIKLEPDEIVMNEIVIKEKQLNEWLKSKGFYARKKMGDGKLFGPEELKFYGYKDFREFIRIIPGLNIRYSQYGRGLYGTGNRLVAVYLDGIQIQDISMLETLGTGQIAAVEFYQRLSSTPLNYSLRYSLPYATLNSSERRQIANRSFGYGGTFLIWTSR